MGGVEKYLNPLDALGTVASEYQRQWERKEDMEVAARNRQQDIDTQYDFAKNSLTWQYAQMNQAGLNPGASISGSHSPSFMPASGDGGGGGSQPNTPNLKWASKEEREQEELQTDLLREQVNGKKIENEALKASLNPTPKIATTKAKIEPKMGIDPKGAEWVTFVTQPDHGLRPVPSESLKQLIEDSPYETEHWLKEGLLPRLGIKTNTKPPRDEFMKKNNIYWKYHPGKGAFYKQTRKSAKPTGIYKHLPEYMHPDYDKDLED